MKNILNILVKILLWLRYRITVKGLDAIQPDNRPILFLPNHPALIDPVIVMSRLLDRFQPRPLADESQVNRMFIRRIIRIFGTIVIPDLSTGGKQNRGQVEAGLQRIIDALRAGDNILLYPAGRLMRSPREDLGANSAVHQIVGEIENVRVVMMRTSGLWGSSFSRADGIPSLLRNLRKHSLHILVNGIFFMPRRPVHIEAYEAVDFPRNAGKMAINAFLEHYYNGIDQPRLQVPYFHGQGGMQQLPEPERKQAVQDTAEIPAATRQLVLDKILNLAGVEQIREEDYLARDLAMDSLVLVEFGLYLGEEFGVPVEHLDGLQTVADCILAAGGIMPEAPSFSMEPVSSSWFAGGSPASLDFPQGITVAGIFLHQAAKNPDQVIIADQISGEKTYRQIIMALYALLPKIKKIPGLRLGIMLPASVSAVISYLAVMFAGREPVMVNWTSGSGQMAYCLKNCGVSYVLTARAFTGRLQNQGVDLEDIDVSWIYLEDLANEISKIAKVTALVKSRLSWQELRRAEITGTAAILFTSGSEAHPKSVPLSHDNFLANGRDFNQVLSLKGSDRLFGVLPVFHSLGLAGTVILPLCIGLRTVYWPNPTEGRQLARMVSAYKTTIFITTPTFLQNMLHQAEAGEMQSLRLVFSGAEKCPESLFTRLGEQAPNAVLCEGYGVTECSPVISVNSIDNPVPGTIGRLLPSMEALFLHPETNDPVTGAKPGRLLVRGPNVFSGYLGEAPSPFVSSGGRNWYDTGDLVTRDQQGILSFAGRLKRFVKLGGEMISLPAIEQVLEEAFAGKISEPILAVLASKDEHPELVLLTVAEISRQQANQALRTAGLSPLHNIRRVQQIDEISLLGTGKIDYRCLQEQV
jgi:long-chain-fatty-acid--[acyl-carrier-protein] ligase